MLFCSFAFLLVVVSVKGLIPYLTHLTKVSLLNPCAPPYHGLTAARGAGFSFVTWILGAVHNSAFLYRGSAMCPTGCPAAAQLQPTLLLLCPGLCLQQWVGLPYLLALPAQQAARAHLSPCGRPGGIVTFLMHPLSALGGSLLLSWDWVIWVSCTLWGDPGCCADSCSDTSFQAESWSLQACLKCISTERMVMDVFPNEFSVW